MQFIYREETNLSAGQRINHKRAIDRFLANQKLKCSHEKRFQNATSSKGQCEKFPKGKTVTWIDGSTFTVSGMVCMKLGAHTVWRITVYESKKARLDPKELALA